MRRVLVPALALILSTAAGAAAMELTSPDFDAGGPIPDRHVFDGFGCTGGNRSPALAWSGAPEGTESFALMVHDPDAPTGGAGFWHWVVVDIPASETGLAQGAGAAGGDALPGNARHVRNDYGFEGWGGPCPPDGDDAHRYDFTLYALPAGGLEIPDGASTSVVGFLINASAIGKATLQGTHAR